MTQYGYANFANDRFENVASAISFNGGYYTVPSGVYFSGDFTVTVWGNLDLNPLNNWAPILCFNNWASNTLGYFQDGICLEFGQFKLPRFFIFYDTTLYGLTYNQAILPNTWIHFAFTLNGIIGSIYINGILATSGYLYIRANIFRTINVFGSIYSDTCYGKIDFIKFYKRSLSSTEIQTESKQIFQKISN